MANLVEEVAVVRDEDDRARELHEQALEVVLRREGDADDHVEVARRARRFLRRPRAVRGGGEARARAGTGKAGEDEEEAAEVGRARRSL